MTTWSAFSEQTFFDELAEPFWELGNDQHVRCLAHIINLAAQDVLNSLKSYCVTIDEEHTDEDELKSEVLDDIDLDEEISDFNPKTTFAKLKKKTIK